MGYLYKISSFCVNKFIRQIRKIYFLCGKNWKFFLNIYEFFKMYTNSERNFEIRFARKKCERDPSSNCRIHAVQWISGKSEDSLRSVLSTRNANLIGSWILSSARNYYLRYKSGDLPRLPSSQLRWTRPAVIIHVHTFTWLSRTQARPQARIHTLLPPHSLSMSVRPRTFTQRSRLPPSVNY